MIYKFYRKRIKRYIPRGVFKYCVNPIISQIKHDESVAMKDIAKNEYFNFLFTQNTKSSNSRVEFIKHVSIEPIIKTIAFYLPQFHPIPENDEWWGKGFTEWTNVTRAVPQFIGHHQPKLPDELGFYDLRMVDIQRRQIEIAKNYGIYGFCYYFYWFGGKRVLELPLENIINNPDLDHPFCVNWANENWTRRWDGRETDVLMQQNHSPEDDLNFIKEVSKLFADRRYIRINGKPLLMTYRPSLLPNAKETTDRWRNYCRESGVGEIFLVSVHAFDQIPPEEIGFDACTEFAPINLNMKNITSEVDMINPNYVGTVFDYESAVQSGIEYKKPEFKKFRSICPSWDNEARKPGRGITLANANPESYQKWLENICLFTNKNFIDNEKIVFVNAWNEWAEGACLEPDRKNGFGYLEATYKTLAKFDRKLMNFVIESQVDISKKSDMAVILHLHFIELWDEISRSLSNLDGKFDLFVSLTGDVSLEIIGRIKKEYPNVHLFILENRGRDILPFMNIFEKIKDLDYEYICKIHSKKSTKWRDGDAWRGELIHALIGSREIINEVKNIFESNNKIGIVVPEKSLVRYKDFVGCNECLVRKMFKKIEMSYTDDFNFPSGSMFWFRPSAMNALLKIGIISDDFEIENGQFDGTLAHAIERSFCLIAEKDGYKTGII